jgi:ArsR family transcriptional regulator
VTSGPSCCPGGLGAPISRSTAEELAGLLKAVADPARGLSQPTVSHHLKVLVGAGLVSTEKRGYWTWYRVLPTRLAELSMVLA